MHLSITQLNLPQKWINFLSILRCLFGLHLILPFLRSSSKLRISVMVVHIKMSRPHDGHPPAFPFGNAFRMIFPRGSYLSPKIAGLLTSFEYTLAERLKKLMLKDQSDVLVLSWMRLAMELLCETFADIKVLIAELRFPVADWDEKWMDAYLDNSVKLLDICLAFSSEISRINQAQLLLQCVLHILDVSRGFPSREQLVCAHSSLGDWMKQICLRNPKLENCSTIVYGLIESLHLPKVKNSAKGKVLMRAIYGLKVQTTFFCSIFAAAFSGSSKPLVDLHVSDKFLWAEAFNNLQANVNVVIRSLISNRSPTLLKELEVVQVSVKRLYPMIDSDGNVLVEEEALKNSVSDLRKSSERLVQGLDLLSKEVEGFFQIVLTGRNALLSGLRVGDSDTHSRLEKNVGEKVMR
ncbi:hypothetical protein NE237_027373 [Protea cynaroides]|uniref:BPS1-like protein n=1 Tax=Protea cynaroides TaxID=273540 RepID=A0A9Q0GMF0_9MAGN|nr:hypothetical protein NE237_027373 [Protea cynaroides]